MVSPSKRVKIAWVLLILSVLGGIWSVVFLAKSGYEKVLMAISWGAITITALDLVATTDVRNNDDD